MVRKKKPTVVRVDRASIRGNRPMVLTEIRYGDDGCSTSTRTVGYVRADGVFHKVKSLGVTTQFNVWLRGRDTDNVEPAYFDPRPGDNLYSFDYRPCDIECRCCGAAFDAADLKQGRDDSGDEPRHNGRVCPKCEMWDCCEVEYEQPTQGQLAQWFHEYSQRTKR